MGKNTDLDFSRYAEDAAQLLYDCATQPIEKASLLLHQAFLRKSTVFACGNGGSASSCSHFIEDLLKLMWQPAKEQRLKAQALTDPTALLLALANDDGYEQVFASQLAMQSSPGDVLLCVSGSGNSKNVLAATSYAQQHQLVTIALTGYDGGALKKMTDCAIHIRSNNMGMLEGVHLLILDYLAKNTRYLAYGIPHHQR